MRGVALQCVVLLLMAGCTSPGSKGGTGSDEDLGSQEIVVVAEDGTETIVVVAADKGILGGRVFGDAGAPIPAAHVSLLNTDFFGDAADDGSFRFVNVTAGSHELFVQAPGFIADRRAVTVTAGELTDVEVVLTADVGIDGGSRVHNHDLWRGATNITLMDDDFELTTDENRGVTYPGYSDATYAVVEPNRNATTFPLILPERDDERAPIIYPGTGLLSITLSWEEPEVTLEDIGLKWTAPGVKGPQYLTNMKSGETRSIAVNASMWDGGHAPWTSWRFNFFYANSAQGSPTTWDPAVVTGPIHVLIIVGKGTEPPLDPPHEDFWAPGNTLALNVSKVVTWVGPDTSRSRPEERLYLANNFIVPPGTTRMRLEFDYEVQSPVDQQRGLAFVLTWRGAERHWYHTPLGDFDTAVYTTGPAGEQVYEFPVRGEQADGYYQKTSNWDWLPAVEGEESETAAYHVGNIAFTLKVTVFRDA